MAFGDRTYRAAIRVYANGEYVGTTTWADNIEQACDEWYATQRQSKAWQAITRDQVIGRYK